MNTDETRTRKLRNEANAHRVQAWSPAFRRPRLNQPGAAEKFKSLKKHSPYRLKPGLRTKLRNEARAQIRRTEIRVPKEDRDPKSEHRTCESTRVSFGLRASDFFRIRIFGLRT